MELADILSLYDHHPLVKELISASNNGTQTSIGFRAASCSHTAVLAAATYLSTGSTQLIVTNSKEDAAYLQNDLEKLLGKAPCYFYPASYRRPYEIEQTDNANVLLRAEVLNHLSSKRRPPIVITYTDALFEKVITRKELETNTLKLHVGEHISLEFLNETLFEYLFERVDFVVHPGQFSVRGGIIDIFLSQKTTPIASNSLTMKWRVFATST